MELSDYERDQLTNGGECAIHRHEVSLEEHRHIESLQSLEVVRTVTANYTVEYREDIIIADTANNNITITLPKSRGGKKFYVVKKGESNTLTIVFSNGETMLGIASVTITQNATGKWFKGVEEGYIPL